jgi:hypothetical protein
MHFANEAAFLDRRSREMALGVDVSGNGAITDAHGRVLACARNGGMLSPARRCAPSASSLPNGAI